MVSAIFAGHDIYWGNTQKQTNGYDVYENIKITELQHKFKSKWGRAFMRPVAATSGVFEQFQNEIKEFVSADKTWMIKTGVEYFPAFESLNPYNVFIKRNPENVAKSLCNKRPGASYDEALNAVKWRFNFMDQLQSQHGGMVVDTDKIINGDFSDIKKAIEYCGIIFNEEAAKRAIKK